MNEESYELKGYGIEREVNQKNVKPPAWWLTGSCDGCGWVATGE